MSLDERMKLIARDEVQRAITGTELEEAKESGGGLAEQVSGLHEHLHRALTLIDHLTQRVSALEAAQAGAAQHPQGDSDGATPLPDAAEPRTARPRRSSRSTGKTT